MDDERRTPTVLIYDSGSVFGQLLARELLAQTTARLLLVGPEGKREERIARELDPTSGRVRAGLASLEDAAGLHTLLEGVDAAVCCVRGFRGVPATMVDVCAARGIAYFD